MTDEIPENERRLFALLAEAGKLIEELPEDERYIAVEAAFDKLFTQQNWRKFLIGVMIIAHDRVSFEASRTMIDMKELPEDMAQVLREAADQDAHTGRFEVQIYSNAWGGWRDITAEGATRGRFDDLEEARKVCAKLAGGSSYRYRVYDRQEGHAVARRVKFSQAFLPSSRERLKRIDVVNWRAVLIDDNQVGDLLGIEPSPGNPHRPTAFEYSAPGRHGHGQVFSRLEEAREWFMREGA